ncbi:hypothetical protein [Streptomyces sp. NPDC004065]|uniref:hypothetical protein n=1 Tax=Streptomyces sp. NPDC004065 TaxID=3364689 RepID=UPI0038503F53
MNSSEYASAVHAALEEPDPRNAVHRIKSIVADELANTDSRATVKKTDFFNHSFAPDLVLSWPGESERLVFLKSDTRPAVLREDVNAIRDKNPIVFALDQLGDFTPTWSSGVPDDDTLVADIEGMEVLIRSRRSDPVVGLASSAILQGGRGLLNESAAENVASSVSRGFSGAQVLDAAATQGAVAQIAGHFDRRRSSRLLRFLSAVWVGSGGTPASFPGEHDVTGDLDSAALEFLLGLPPIEDQEFWRRIGRSLTLESLASLKLEYDSQNLQYVVGANLDVLHARACRIHERQLELGEDRGSGFRWSLDRELLCLRGSRNIAYFAAKSEDLKVEAEEQDGITLQELLRRADSVRIPISELELATPTRTVSYATVNRDDISHDQELIQLSETFSSMARVKSAVATLMGSRPLICDFPSRTGKARTASKFPLGVFAPIALSLLTELSSSEKRSLDEVARLYSYQVDTQPGLFDMDRLGAPSAVTTLSEVADEGGE